MNIQQFLEEENERFYAEPVRELHLKEENADGSFSEQAYMHNWLKDHDTLLINKVLDEVRNKVEKKLEEWDESAEELEDGWGNYTVCLPWEIKEKKLQISTIIDQLKLK